MKLYVNTKVKCTKEMEDFLKELDNYRYWVDASNEFPHSIIEYNNKDFSIELLNRDKVSPIVLQLFNLLEDEVKSRREEAMKMLREIIIKEGCFVELQLIVDKYFHWKKEKQKCYYKYKKSPLIDELMEKYFPNR
jgi:hypothetical protein